jgi:hypothetical protein
VEVEAEKGEIPGALSCRIEGSAVQGVGIEEGTESVENTTSLGTVFFVENETESHNAGH